MKTDISVLLDRSGSMASIAADTVGGFNRFLADQQAIPGEAVLTLAQFDTVGFDYIANAKPLKDVAPLTSETFVPRGGTPLHDAMGRLIVETGARLKAMAEHERPQNVVFVVITDGEENSSHEYTGPKIAQMVTHQRDIYKWQFVYLGANQDAVVAASHMGIPAMAAASYTADPAGVKAAYSLSSNLVRSARLGASASISEEERKKLISKR